MVFGGSSGIGFSSAAMFVQECAERVVILGRNAQKGELAATVINQEASQAHCSNTTGQPVVTFIQANTVKRSELKAAFEQIKGSAHVVVNTAGIPGWTGIGLPDIPDDAWLGEEDAIHNNLYGVINVMTVALRHWNFTNCVTSLGQPSCPSPGFMPAIVNVASVQGLTPAPAMLMYGVSKAGIISATQTVAATYGANLRANVVAPGLVSTPLTWNQVRSYTMEKNGTAENAYPKLQFGFQCVDASGQVIVGDCKGGGTGYGCPCEDVKLEDPRIDAVFSGYPVVDPRKISSSVLFLASDEATAVNGETYVVGNALDDKPWSCPPLQGPPLPEGSCCAPSKPAAVRI